METWLTPPSALLLSLAAPYGDAAVRVAFAAALAGAAAGTSAAVARMWRLATGVWPAWWVTLWGGTVLLAAVWVLAAGMG